MSVNLHCEIQGEGRPLLILHGLFGSGRNWAGLARRFAENYRVVNVDLRNHGKSPKTGTMTYLDMSGDLLSLVEGLKIRDINLVGHSMGGKAAMIFALQNRGLVDKLIVLDMAPVRYGNGVERLVHIMKKLPVETITSRKEADEMLQPDIRSENLRGFLLQNLVQTGGQGYEWRIGLDAIAADLRDLGGFPAPTTVPEYTGKALFLAGGDSDYIQERHHAIIRKYFSKARLHCIDGAGHWLHADQPEAVYRRIIAFLEEAE